MSTDDEVVCGETIDHDERTTFENQFLRQWECQRCGAEGIDDKAEET